MGLLLFVIIIASLFVLAHSAPIGNLVLVYVEQSSAAKTQIHLQPSCWRKHERNLLPNVINT